MADRLLTTREVQEFLQVDRITIYRMLEAGEIPAVKVGGQWRFSQAAIDEWLKGRGSRYVAAPPAQLPAPLPPSEALAIAARPLETLRVCDLVAPSCLEIIQGSFAQALGVGVGITDLAGAPLVPFSNPCAFCLHGWASADFQQRCQGSWSGLSALEEPEPRVHVCHAGIGYAVAPLRVGEQHLGLLVAGQFLLAPADATFRRRVRQVAADCGLEGEGMLARIPSLRHLDGERVQLTERLLVTIASAISEIATQNYRVREKLAQIAHLAEAA
jgi:excisionase family DNA binding protein